MKRILVTGLWVAVCTYLAGLLVFGKVGILASREALSAKDGMVQNVATLDGVHSALMQEWNALQSDPGRIALEGRALGYVASKETMVRLERSSLQPAPEVLHPGTIQTYAPALRRPDTALKISACIAGLAWIVGLSVAFAFRRRKENGG